MKKCRCSNGKYSVRCCKSQGVGTSVSTPKAYTPKHSTYGTDWAQRARLSGAASRRMSKLGSALENLGKIQLANAPFAQPKSSGKIWTPHTKKSMKIHNPDIPRSIYKKYDFRPRGNTLRGSFRDSNIAKRGTRSNFRYGEVEEHWRRNPNRHGGGIYSHPSPADVRHHRRIQARRGTAKIATGKSMKTLGNGLLAVQLGTYAWWLYQDPSNQTAARIVEDATAVRYVESTFLDVLWFVAPEELDRYNPLS